MQKIGQFEGPFELQALSKERGTVINDRKPKIEVLIAKLGLDGREVGPLKISRWVRDAGMDAIYMGRYQWQMRWHRLTVFVRAGQSSEPLLSEDTTL